MTKTISILSAFMIFIWFMPWDSIWNKGRLKNHLKMSKVNEQGKENILLKYAKKVGAILPKRENSTRKKKIENLIIAANLDGKIEYAAIEGVMVVLPVLSGVLLLGSVVYNPSTLNVLRFLVVVAIAYYVPVNILSNKANARKKMIQREMASVLNTLAIITDSGLGFNDAIERICEIREGAFIEELERMQLEVKMGTIQRDALYRMANRCQVSELYTFTFALVQAQEKGASGISDALRNQSEEIWKMRKARAEEIGEKASSKLFLALLLLVLPGFLIFILGPAVIDIMRTFG